MATYIFECKECEKQEEKDIPMSEYDKLKNEQKCSKCGGDMFRVFVPINDAIYNAHGFYVNP